MNDPYARLRAIIEAAEAGEPLGRPRTRSAGELLVGRLRDLGRDKALHFEATAGEVNSIRDGARSALLAGEHLSIYRLDPRGPGGASRKTTWEAVLIRPGKEAA